jgi:hypothetical protein
LNPPSGATIASLDFESTEAVSAVTNVLTVGGPYNGVGAGEIEGNFVTAAGTISPMFRNQVPGSPTITFYSIPTSHLVDGDMHVINAFLAGGFFELGVRKYYRSASDISISTGDFLTTSTCSHNAEMPYPIFRCNLASQADYGAAAQWAFEQVGSSRSLTFTLTAGYFGGTPSTWEVALPSFPASLGFDPAWVLQRGVPLSYWTSAFSGRGAIQLGARANDGEVVKYARSQGFWTP